MKLQNKMFTLIHSTLPNDASFMTTTTEVSVPAADVVRVNPTPRRLLESLRSVVDAGVSRRFFSADIEPEAKCIRFGVSASECSSMCVVSVLNIFTPPVRPSESSTSCSSTGHITASDT